MNPILSNLILSVFTYFLLGYLCTILTLFYITLIKARKEDTRLNKNIDRFLSLIKNIQESEE